MNKIVIIFPGFLEAFTNRGGGREARLSRVALELSNSYEIAILAPFFAVFKSSQKKNNKLEVNDIFFPSSKEYPPKSFLIKLLQLFSIPVYSFYCSMKIIQKRKETDLIIVSDFMSGLLPSIVAKVFLHLKVSCYEGNITPWADPSLTFRSAALSESLLNALTMSIAKVTAFLANGIIVNDGLIKNGLIKSGVADNKIFVIRGIVDTTAFKPSGKPKRPEFVVAFNGRLTKEKGAHLLVNLCVR